MKVTTAAVLCALTCSFVGRSSHAQETRKQHDTDPVNAVVLALVDRLSDTTAQVEIVRYHRGRQRNLILVTRDSASPAAIARALGLIMHARSHDKETALGPLGKYSKSDPRLVERSLQHGAPESKPLTRQVREAADAYLVQLLSAPRTAVRGAGNVRAITIKLASEIP